MLTKAVLVQKGVTRKQLLPAQFATDLCVLLTHQRLPHVPAMTVHELGIMHDLILVTAFIALNMYSVF